MPRIWFTADLHLGHGNIIRYSKRPFDSVDVHDATLIGNWNNCVEPTDTVYLLGDLAYGNKESATAYRKRLNGNIFFIEGNHDKAAFQIRSSFTWYGSVYEAKFQSQFNGDPVSGSIFLSHYAHRVWDKSHHGAYHLYGHSHNSLPELSDSLSFDVGVDAIAARLSGKPAGEAYAGLRPEDYRPFSLEEVIAVMQTKTFMPIDHHGRNAD